jgi:hypothetical protein
MFDTYYPYRFIQRTKNTVKGTYLYEHKYRFVGKNNRTYIVNIEEYAYNVFVVKFHLKAHTNSENKYRLMVGDSYAPSIISTVIEIMVSIYKSNLTASFGFIGSRSMGEKKGWTQRARIYEYIISQSFPPSAFSNFKNDKYSAYLMINAKVFSEKLKNDIESMFLNMYDFDQLLNE